MALHTHRSSGCSVGMLNEMPPALHAALSKERMQKQKRNMVVSRKLAQEYRSDVLRMKLNRGDELGSSNFMSTVERFRDSGGGDCSSPEIGPGTYDHVPSWAPGPKHATSSFLAPTRIGTVAESRSPPPGHYNPQPLAPRIPFWNSSAERFGPIVGAPSQMVGESASRLVPSTLTSPHTYSVCFRSQQPRFASPKPVSKVGPGDYDLAREPEGGNMSQVRPSSSFLGPGTKRLPTGTPPTRGSLRYRANHGDNAVPPRLVGPGVGLSSEESSDFLGQDRRHWLRGHGASVVNWKSSRRRAGSSASHAAVKNAAIEQGATQRTWRWRSELLAKEMAAAPSRGRGEPVGRGGSARRRRRHSPTEPDPLASHFPPSSKGQDTGNLPNRFASSAAILGNDPRIPNAEPQVTARIGPGSFRFESHVGVREPGKMSPAFLSVPRQPFFKLSRDDQAKKNEEDECRERRRRKLKLRPSRSLSFLEDVKRWKQQGSSELLFKPPEDM